MEASLTHFLCECVLNDLVVCGGGGAMAVPLAVPRLWGAVRHPGGAGARHLHITGSLLYSPGGVKCSNPAAINATFLWHFTYNIPQ